MPQITLEYTTNVANASDWGGMLLHVHKLIHARADIPLDHCKSRVLEHVHFLIGEGGKDKAFVHLEVALLEGRSDSLKAELGNMLLTHLQTLLLPENTHHELQISIEIRDINRSSYFKFPKLTHKP